MATSGTSKLPDYLFSLLQSQKESGGTPSPRKELDFIPASHSWDNGWELASDLHIEVNMSQEEAVAVSCSESQEYGVGNSLESAIADLLTSLSDYYDSLDSRQGNLAEPAVRDLLRNSADDIPGHWGPAKAFAPEVVGGGG